MGVVPMETIIGDHRSVLDQNHSDPVKAANISCSWPNGKGKKRREKVKVTLTYPTGPFVEKLFGGYSLPDFGIFAFFCVSCHKILKIPLWRGMSSTIPFENCADTIDV